MAEAAVQTGSAAQLRAPISNIPFDRNAGFVGRADVLARLRQAFASPQPAQRVQAVYGVGGVGKTQLALEYAFRYQSEYQLIWWLRSETPAMLAEGYAQLARALGAAVAGDATLGAIRETVKGLLDQRDHWLLVLDNAADPKATAAFLPEARKGHVLITTRQPNWPGVAQTLGLDVLARGDSLALIRRQAGRDVDSGDADQLAQALGDLPLALAQASACIQHSGSSVADYLRIFEALWAELLQTTRPGGDYPDSVAMTMELAMRQVEQLSLVSGELLNLCAFLDPDEIPRRLLSHYPAALREPLATAVANPLELEEAIGHLARFALIESTEKSVSLHRLVALLARDRVSTDERRAWAEMAVRLLAAIFNFDTQDLATWPDCAIFLPHALSTAFHAQTLGVAPDAACELLDDAGRYLLRRGQVAEAKDAFEQAMNAATRLYGKQHPRISVIANNLGRAMTRLGQRDEAIRLFEQAIAVDQSAYGHADPHVATVVNNYGKALHATGDVESARKQFEWALQVYQAHYGQEHAKVAAVTNNLGYVLLHLGDTNGAKEHLERALEIAQRTCGRTHPTVASILYNLASLRRATGDRAGARQCLEQALSIDQAAYGPMHPDVARDSQHLGELLKDLGELDAAKAHLDRAMSILAESEARPGGQ